MVNVGWEADQYAITIVESTEEQSSDKRLEDGRRDEMADAAKLMQCCDAAHHRPTHVSAYHHIAD